MKAVIVGASGFLGSHLLDHWQKTGRQVIPMSFRTDNRETFMSEMERVLTEESIDAIILAGASQTGKEDLQALYDLIQSNVYLPAAVASLIQTKSPSTVMVHFGTSWQYDHYGSVSPFNAYAASKSAAEDFLWHYALNGIKIVSLRLFDTYGPGDQRNKIMNLIADALLADAPLDMSAGEQSIDLVHINDVLRAVDIVIDQMKSAAWQGLRCYSIRSGRIVTVKELLATMLKVHGKGEFSKFNLGHYPYRVRERFSLSPDLNCPPGWRAEISLEEGIANLLTSRKSAIQPN